MRGRKRSPERSPTGAFNHPRQAAVRAGNDASNVAGCAVTTLRFA
jgi:hypothetical protein